MEPFLLVLSRIPLLLSLLAVLMAVGLPRRLVVADVVVTAATDAGHPWR